MAGGSPNHAAIAINVASVLREQLRGRPCRVFGSDLRIRVRASGLATYSDASVVRSHLEVDPDDPSELWRRDDERWTVELARGNEVAHLSSIDCSLPLAEIYLDPLA